MFTNLRGIGISCGKRWNNCVSAMLPDFLIGEGKFEAEPLTAVAQGRSWELLKFSA
jgi:hypothetical protein